MSEIPKKTRNFIFALVLTALLFVSAIMLLFEVENWRMVALFSLFTVIAEKFLVQIQCECAISVSF